MLSVGQTLPLDIEKPAAGGRMIARANGHVVLVAGAIPGERAMVRIERVAKGVAYGQAISIESPSADRRTTTGDPLCGGCLYAEIAYPRQLAIKAQVIADAFGRIGRIPWVPPIVVAPSPEDGYRMRARLHLRGGRLGFFREGSHELCDIRKTRQLLASSCDVLDEIEARLQTLDVRGGAEIELSENVRGSERTVHVEGAQPIDPASLLGLADIDGVTGVTVGVFPSSAVEHASVVSGNPRVHDVLQIDDVAVAIDRHVMAFFQGNRFLLEPLAAHVVAAMPHGATVVDLYAGTGLFSLAAARVRGATVTAVEGDLVSAADLALNAAAAGGRVEARHESVEVFTARRQPSPNTLIVDPPRTGMSRAALDGALALRAERLVYVSCDVATLARDARRVLDGGYALERIDAFDLFPSTPHVETVAIFVRA